MPFTRLQYGKVWTSSGDFPTFEESEMQVREDLQYHPDAVKLFLNNTLLKELEASSAAGKIGDGRKGNLAATLSDIYATLSTHAKDIENLAAGEAPESVKASAFAFASTDWISSGSVYKLTIPRSSHKRISNLFGYKLEYNASGTYLTNVWATAGTDVVYDLYGNVVLTSDSAYSGRIVFYGV